MTGNPTIDVARNGPYVVRGRVPLHRKRAITSEHGDPMTWQTDEPTPAGDSYPLCRCGGSANKPFCDGTHARAGFDGTEAAPTDAYVGRQKDYPGTGIVVHDDRGICEHAGFCGNRVSNVWKMTGDAADPIVRAQIMAMVERCPSGALTYSVDGVSVEPDLRVAVGVVENGPLWVTGGIPVRRADGAPLETRNRMTLCRCGGSHIKPLCDGTHKEIGFTG